MPLPRVAIVGRPNVGKSSLLNALARRRISIVDPRPGVTRDRVSAIVEHGGRYFEALDTGGYGIVDRDHLEAHVEEQIRHGIEQADVVLFVLDVRDGVTPLDVRMAELLRRARRPVIAVANKVDTEGLTASAGEFQRLGHGEALCVSAKHFRGRVELLDRVAAMLPAGGEEAPAAAVMKLAIVGKRNAGKSTLVNVLAGGPRMIVSEVPGTTRDAVDVRFEKDGRTFLAIDTAGVRKKSKMQDIEFYSHERATRSIRRADVVLMLIDATVPVGEVDQKLARVVADEDKPLVLAVNKWDLAREQAATSDYQEYLARTLTAVDCAPIVFMTASQGHNVDAAVDMALKLHRQATTRVTTGQLNTVLEAVLAERGPAARRGTKLLKVYYGTQVATSPPTLVLFCNDPTLVGEDYRRFLRRRLRESLPFQEVPIKLVFRPRRPTEATARR